MNSKKIFNIIILGACFVLVFGLGVWIGDAKVAYCVHQPDTIDFSLFWDAYKALQKNFITPEKITNQKVVYGAIEGMTNALKDPYTDFFNPDQAKIFQQNLAGSFSGIGVEVGNKQGLLTVIAPLKGTPGEKAGLKPGDIIAKIDGKDATNMATDEAVNLIRGPKGTSVTITILRDTWNSTKDFKITRDTIKVPSIEWSLKNGNVAYIQIYQFDETLSSDFQTIALQILQSPAKKIVLDLRGNPGGYLSVAQDLAGWFLQKGQTVTIEDFGKDKANNPVYNCGTDKSLITASGEAECIFSTDGNSELADYPMVVLINQGSASASEILSGALRDNRKVELIGTKSFGKGCVQDQVPLRDGSFLKITIANWLTPKGNSITDVGLTPDVKVDMTDKDVAAKKDPQLDKALEIIKGLD